MNEHRALREFEQSSMEGNGRVYLELETAEKNIASLEQAIRDLGKKLTPVLETDKPSAEKMGVLSTGTDCPLVLRIRETVDKTNELNSLVSNLLERLAF